MVVSPVPGTVSVPAGGCVNAPDGQCGSCQDFILITVIAKGSLRRVHKGSLDTHQREARNPGIQCLSVSCSSVVTRREQWCAFIRDVLRL